MYTEGESSRAWVGPSPTGLQIAALLTVGTVGMMITGVQPVVFGALVGEHRLSVSQLGLATTAEFLAFGLAVLIAGAAFRPNHLRVYGLVSSLIVVGSDLGATWCSGSALILDRAIAGAAEGILLWLPVCMIARSNQAAFWSAVFITIQTLAQLAYAAIVPSLVMERFGANGAVVMLAATGAIAALASLFVPKSFQPLTAPDELSTDVTPAPRRVAGAVALGALFFAAAYEIGFYAFFEPLAARAGHGAKVVGTAVSMALVGQVCGSSLAAIMARRVHHLLALVIWGAVNVAVLWAFDIHSTPFLFVTAATVFGFIWLFFMPFQVPLIIEADPTRRTALLLPGAQLLGGAAGPFLCSLAVTDSDAGGAVLVCAACLAASVIPLVGHAYVSRALRQMGAG